MEVIDWVYKEDPNGDTVKDYEATITALLAKANANSNRMDMFEQNLEKFGWGLQNIGDKPE